MSTMGGKILTHETDMHTSSYMLFYHPQNFFCAGKVVGKDEVANNQSPLCNSLFIDLEWSHLPIHFLEGSEVVSDILLCVREF